MTPVVRGRRLDLSDGSYAVALTTEPQNHTSPSPRPLIETNYFCFVVSCFKSASRRGMR